MTHHFFQPIEFWWVYFCVLHNNPSFFLKHNDHDDEADYVDSVIKQDTFRGPIDEDSPATYSSAKYYTNSIFELAKEPIHVVSELLDSMSEFEHRQLALQIIHAV